MRTLENIVIKVDQINDFMECVEDVMISTADEEGFGNSMKKLHNLVYILMDQLQTLGKDIEEANGHIKVCNAIMASAHVRAMELELAELRRQLGVKKDM